MSTYQKPTVRNGQVVVLQDRNRRMHAIKISDITRIREIAPHTVNSAQLVSQCEIELHNGTEAEVVATFDNLVDLIYGKA
jgi:hypothetical protein